MARLCGVSYNGYKEWETKGKSSVKALYAIREGIKVCAPSLPDFDILRIEEPDFPDWLEAQLKGVKATPLSASERALDDLIRDGELWKSLGGSTALSLALRAKLSDYRDDLDKEDWVAVIKMLQGERKAEEEWKFKDPQVLARRARFKAPKGFVLTDRQWAKIERIITEEVIRLQIEDKGKGEE